MCSASVRSPKQDALGLVEDHLPHPLKFIQETVKFPGLDVTLTKFPKNIASIDADGKVRGPWGPTASRLLGWHLEPILTQLGKKISEEEAIRFCEFVITNYVEDPEVLKIELSALEDWKKDYRRGIRRNFCNPYQVIGRGLLYDPSWYPPEVEVSCYHQLPDFRPTTWDKIDIPPFGNTGFWLLKPWCDRRRTFAAEQAFHMHQFKRCLSWKNRIMSLNKLTAKSVGAVSPPLAGYVRLQSGGRLVFALSKDVAFWLMRYSQVLSKLLMYFKAAWYATGDLESTLAFVDSLIDGFVGQHVVRGDDFLVRAGDVIVSGDTTSFDGSITHKENLKYLDVVLGSLPDYWRKLFRACHLAAGSVQAAISVGMLNLPLNRGNVSGRPDTTIFNSWVQSSRIMRCNWLSGTKGIEEMNRFGILRDDKQFTLEYTGTFCQKIVSKAYPGEIFGITARIIRSLREREARSVAVQELVGAEEDSRVVQVVASLYGSPTWAPVVEWVKQLWDIRTPFKLLWKLIQKWRSQSGKPTGTLERRALLQTLLRFLE